LASRRSDSTKTLRDSNCCCGLRKPAPRSGSKAHATVRTSKSPIVADGGSSRRTQLDAAGERSHYAISTRSFSS
jgi:hypothetical protein